MRHFSIYESISAALLAISIVSAGSNMAGQESILNRASNIEPPVAPSIRVGLGISTLVTPTPADDMDLMASPIERLSNEVFKNIDINDLDAQYEITEDAEEEIIEIEETTFAIETETEETEAFLAEEEDSEDQIAETTGESTTTVTETTQTVVEEIVEEPAPEPEPEPEPEPDPEPSYSINYPPSGTVDYEVFVLVNEARIANGLSPLSWSGGLADCANVRASEAQDYFSHTRPDGSDWWTVNPDIMYGENLAQGQTSAQQVFNDWMNSPDHRANILKPEYVTYGSARVNDTWAQEFGY